MWLFVLTWLAGTTLLTLLIYVCMQVSNQRLITEVQDLLVLSIAPSCSYNVCPKLSLSNL